MAGDVLPDLANFGIENADLNPVERVRLTLGVMAIGVWPSERSDYERIYDLYANFAVRHHDKYRSI